MDFHFVRALHRLVVPYPCSHGKLVIPCGHETYLKAVPMTRLGKLARLPREMRVELNVRLRLASAFAKATADKPTRQVRLQKGEVGRHFKAQFPTLRSERAQNSDWKPPRKPRGCEQTKTHDGRAQNFPGEAQEGEPAETPIKPNQTKSNQIKLPVEVVSGQWTVVGGRRGGGKLSGQTQSKPVKPSQTSCGSGQWTVDSGQWLVAKGGGGRLSGQTESNPVKPEGLAVCRT
jgi:hypothetical protein